MTILSKARCFVCGSIIRLDPNGDWHCPVCGAYDGNGHIEWLDGEEVDTQMSVDDGKFYWLKLKRDFFKRHDIRIIEDMPNGTEYVLFYLKLLVESIDHQGNLRFSDQIPYSDEMLASVTNTNIDIVRSAIVILERFGLIAVSEDGTIKVFRKKESARDRNSPRYRAWRTSVFDRDKYTCAVCGRRGVKLNAHHIESWADFPDRRYDIDNGITLCQDCHKQLHKKLRGRC